jgi:WhiB family transcriptional regulator, redox-sensing transcriptional regulator
MADFSRLPGPNADLWDWQLRGLCRGKDSSLFFHPEGERGAARSSRESAAKEICMNCPVQISCADHALKVREPYGVWGGMTEEEREEHHARQKALIRAQAAREKTARMQQEKLKERLLREKALQNLQKERALASAAAAKAEAEQQALLTEAASRSRVRVAALTVANTRSKANARTSAPPAAAATPKSVAPKKQTARKKTKPLVKA